MKAEQENAKREEVVELLFRRGATATDIGVDSISQEDIEYLKQGAKIATQRGENFLGTTVIEWRPDRVRFLLDLGVSPDMTSGRRPLISVAANLDRTEIVRMLFKAGAKPDNVALCQAAFDGRDETVESLLDNGTSVNARAKDGIREFPGGEAALDWTAREGRASASKLLQDRGAVVYEDVYQLIRDGKCRGNAVSRKVCVSLLMHYYNEQKADGVEQSYWLRIVPPLA